MHFNSFKKSVGKTIKEDHIVAAMPRIRISAAKSQNRQSTFIGSTNRNILPTGGEQVGLTAGNLSKMQGTEESKTLDPAIRDAHVVNANMQSQDDISDSSPGPTQRRNFARGISLQVGDKNGSQLRHLTAIALSAHHRFDKESVHLRSMYRKLYPSEGPKTNAVKILNTERSQDSFFMINGGNDYSPERNTYSKKGATANPAGYQTSFARRHETLPIGGVTN